MTALLVYASCWKENKLYHSDYSYRILFLFPFFPWIHESKTVRLELEGMETPPLNYIAGNQYTPSSASRYRPFNEPELAELTWFASLWLSRTNLNTKYDNCRILGLFLLLWFGGWPSPLWFRYPGPGWPRPTGHSWPAPCSRQVPRGLRRGTRVQQL